MRVSREHVALLGVVALRAHDDDVLAELADEIKAIMLEDLGS